MKRTRNWKTWISMASVITLAVGAAACSKGEAGSSAEPSSNAAASASTEPVKFRMFVSDFNLPYPSATSMEIPGVKYMAEKTNTNIDLVFLPHGQYNEQLRVKFASGDIPDVYLAWGIAGSEPVLNGMALELDELIDKYGPNLKKQIPQSSWDAVTLNGKIMAIPQPALYNAPAERMIYVRKDWMDKLGLQQPKTSEELLQVLRAFKEKDPNGNGTADEIPFTSREKFTWIENLFGMWGVNPSAFTVYNNEVVPGFIHPNTKQGLEFLRKLHAEKLIDSEFLTNTSTVWKQKILSDKVGMFVHNSHTGGTWYRDLKDSLKDKLDADLMAISTPQGIGYDGPVGRVERPVGKSFIIFKQSPNPEAIIKFFDWLVTDEGNFFAAYGFEGEALSRVGNDLVYDSGKEKDFQSNWRAANFDIIDLDHMDAKIKQDPDIYQHQMQGLELARKEGIPNLLEAMPVPASLSSQGELNWSGSLFQEAAAKIVFGDKPLDYYDEFVATWKKQGGDKIIKEATDWYNANVKAVKP